MTERIVLDYNNMLAERIGEHGISSASIDTAATRFSAVHADTQQRRDSGELGFLQLPYEHDVVEQIRSFADGVGQAFDTVVVLGIGGSALGMSALLQALRPPRWNELDDEAREYFPKLYVLDNVDPVTVGALLDRLDLRRTLFNVISKSGATAETMAQYLVVRDRLQRELDEEGVRGHLIFTTDPEKGVLRRIAAAEQISTLPVPPAVGGRFSVLSAVGLLPAALVGIDVAALLAGAADMIERCGTSDLRANPAALFAVLQYLAQTEKGAPMHVMMPYSDQLAGLSDWYCQLWAESLGKRKDRAGRDVFRGPTPVSALGATDQHSQVQLYMEGPFDKTITFLAVKQLDSDVAVPRLHEDIEDIAYLGGATLGSLLTAELHATAAALSRNGRMNMRIEVPRVDAHAIGQLLMMLQIATVYAGGFYDVNPLDQPGVELGKQLTYGLMGRSGFEEQKTDAPDPRWISA
ncbi:MAG TPA: glucose-6-phosphate isomerase [Longimicrobiales bacterium]